jgi:23S rRNA (uracil1939-C5)-methyltransferase
MSRPSRPDALPDLHVTWISPDGTVGGRLPKGTFKLRGALPGDRVRALEADRRGRTWHIGRWEPIASVERLDHPCPVVDACGGCDLGRLAPSSRQDALTRMVQQALRAPDPPEWIAPEVGVRSRITLAIDDDGVGFHAARSHERVVITGCSVAHPLIDAVIPGLLDGGCPPGARSLELRTDGDRVVGVLDAGRITDDHLPTLEHVAIGGRTVRGDPTLTLEVAGIPLRASPRSFFQVNAAGNALLVARVLGHVDRIRPERVLDLYSGIGNLTLPIAARGIPTAAVELEGQATADLRFNAARADLSVDVHTGAVERFDTTRIPFDMVVLDPPRAGAPGVIDRLLVQRPRAISYVSCHVPSAARDIRAARSAGYRLTDVAAVDLFPGTHHIETVLLLERS